MSSQLLVIGPAWVGDMIMAQVLFKVLKQQTPELLLDVLAPASTYPLLACMPEVRHAIQLPLKHGELGLSTRYRMGRSLQTTGYSRAILLSNTWKSALIPFWARIPQRTGWLGEARYGWVNDIRPLDKTRYPLMIERFAMLAPISRQTPLPTTSLPWPSLSVTEANVAHTLATQGLNTERSILALCPGAEYGPAKRWPAAYFAEVARHKTAEGWQVWIIGGPNDQTIAHEIQHASQSACIDLTGKTSLPDAINLLSLADTVVSNDSGLMHIAAALERPLVVIYGSSDPGFTPPLTQHASILSLKLPCSPCFERQCPLHHMNCLHELRPERVLQAMAAL